MKKSPQQAPTWCPGCGTYGVLAALKGAISDLNLKPKDVVVCYDIGCSGNMINNLDVCGIATLHGRSIPVASGVKSARRDLTVIAQGGDGGILSEGLNHFVHAIQRDDDITLIVNNNLVFGLTAGQQSSATPRGVQARLQKTPNLNNPLNIVDLAATCGARFVARVPEADINLMRKLIVKAICHQGFSLIEVIQPCKIWAKGFPQTKPKPVKTPFADSKKLIRNHSITGLLYRRKK